MARRVGLAAPSSTMAATSKPRGLTGVGGDEAGASQTRKRPGRDPSSATGEHKPRTATTAPTAPLLPVPATTSPLATFNVLGDSGAALNCFNVPPVSPTMSTTDAYQVFDEMPVRQGGRGANFTDLQEFFDDLSSEEEEEDEWDDDEDITLATLLEMESRKRNKHGGSIHGREFIRRKRQEGHEKLMAEYIGPNPVYPPHLFRRRFRMSPDLFKRIAAAVEGHDQYFMLARNTLNRSTESTCHATESPCEPHISLLSLDHV